MGAEALRQAMLAAGVDSWNAMMPILKAHNDALPNPHTAQAKEEGIDKAFKKKADEMLEEFPYHPPEFWVRPPRLSIRPSHRRTDSRPIAVPDPFGTDSFPFSCRPSLALPASSPFFHLPLRRDSPSARQRRWQLRWAMQATSLRGLAGRRS